MNKMRNLSLGLLIIFASLFAFTGATQASPGDDLAGINTHVEAAIAKLDANDVAGAKSELDAFYNAWFDIEDGILNQSRDFYRAIEEATGDARFEFTASPVDVTAARAALVRLDSINEAFIDGQPLPAGTPSTAPSTADVTVASIVARLDAAIEDIGNGQVAAAAAEIDAFRSEWVDVEGVVAVKSAAAYTSVENNMAKAYGLLTQPTPDLAAARSTIAQMKADLEPYAVADLQYGIFDAAIILIREGLEALLIVAAMLAFLNRTGNAEKKGWVWSGAAAGLLASVAVAVIVNVVFSAATRGANRELLEGFTGLVAAAMLLYMTFWLHAKSSMAGWRKYLNSTAGSAIARNSLISLAFISFLAVFREGAETVLFYVGIAPSIATSSLLMGIAIALAFLATFGTLVFFAGVHISVRPFFRVASVLIYYLAFKFVGVGVHALQVAGMVPATHVSFLPSNDFFGVYPTWQTAVAQVVLIAVTAAGFLYMNLRERRSRERRAASRHNPATTG